MKCSVSLGQDVDSLKTIVKHKIQGKWVLQWYSNGAEDSKGVVAGNDSTWFFVSDSTIRFYRRDSLERESDYVVSVIFWNNSFQLFLALKDKKGRINYSKSQNCKAYHQRIRKKRYSLEQGLHGYEVLEFWFLQNPNWGVQFTGDKLILQTPPACVCGCVQKGYAKVEEQK